MTTDTSLATFVQQYFDSNGAGNLLPANTIPQAYQLAFQAIEQWIDNKIQASGGDGT